MAQAKYKEWLTKEGLIKIEGWARDGLTDEQIAYNMDISRSTLNDWKKKYSDISDTLKRGKEVVDRQVENALLKRALGYEFVEVTKERMSSESQKERHKGQSELTEKQWDTCITFFDSKCCYCGKSGKLTKDHLQPLKEGGALEIANVVPACSSCNSSKKANQWLSWFQKQKFYTKEKAELIHKWINFSLSIKQLFEEDDKEAEMVVSKEVTKHVAGDTTAQIFWLKNRKPKEWRDKRETELSGNVGVSNPYADLTTEELRRLANVPDDG